MNRKLWISLALGLALLASLLTALTVAANPPSPETPVTHPGGQDKVATPGGKNFDQPNPKDAARLKERWNLLEAGQTAQANALATTGTDRVLVILVEFGGPDVITWTAPTNPVTPSTGSTWDPIAKSDPNEAVTDSDGNVIVGDCSKIISKTTKFTYSGPLHNELPRPLSEADRSGQSIWTPDFSKQWFHDFMFGSGVTFSYTRTDNSVVYQPFPDKSVTDYYKDMSGGTYTLTGDVYGWLKVPHSQMWYGADKCPGNRSGMTSGGGADAGIKGAGSPVSLVVDAINALNAISNTIPGFNWKNYDTNGDGVIDRLWIVHAGYGEEDGTDLLNRVLPYGEGAVWSHSSGVTPPYKITPDVSAGAYIMMPENGGIGVFAHESAHNIGAVDLYAYSGGNPSPGFWALQDDDWTGFPIGYEPPAMDPWHLDLFGWLNPRVITDTSKVYEFNIGQTSQYAGGDNTYRGAKIELPSGHVPLSVKPIGNYGWWGGKSDLMNSMMTQKTAVSLPAGKSATLSFDLSYYVEDQWDFVWVQASTDGGTTWKTLTNAHTSCEHDPGWIGGNYGFPTDLCGAGIGGFTGEGSTFPAYRNESFDLSSFAGKNVQVRFWYMTDWGTTYDGAFVDNVKITSGGSQVFFDDAEAGPNDNNWIYAEQWMLTDGTKPFTHNIYLQWRNVHGGYDESLGTPQWRYGPANTGLLVWYNNNAYSDNEILNYLNDYPGFGAKGLMLAVDAHPIPYRDPYWVNFGIDNEGSNVVSRMLMRDAPFSLWDSVPFNVTQANGVHDPVVQFPGRPAVASFHDAYTYYPGGELKPGGPVGQTSPRWMTKQWDASAVVPATKFYGVVAPGYNGTDRWRYDCSRSDANQVLCYSYASLGYTGSMGNPGDIDAAYGWHVQILSQTDNGATVRVWNAARSDALTPSVTQARLGNVVKYTYNLQNNWAGQQTYFVCSDLDSQVTYVAGSATNGAAALPGSCASADAALAEGRSLADLAGPDATTAVKSVGMIATLPGTGEGLTFDYQVKIGIVNGQVSSSAKTYVDGTLLRTTAGTPVQVVSGYKLYLPKANR
jgi:immune inhibitor A